MLRFPSIHPSIPFQFVAERFQIPWVPNSVPHYVPEGGVRPILLHLYSILILTSRVILFLLFCLWVHHPFYFKYFEFWTILFAVFNERKINIFYITSTATKYHMPWLLFSVVSQVNQTLSVVNIIFVLMGFTVIIMFLLSGESRTSP